MADKPRTLTKKPSKNIKDKNPLKKETKVKNIKPKDKSKETKETPLKSKSLKKSKTKEDSREGRFNLFKSKKSKEIEEDSNTQGLRVKKSSKRILRTTIKDENSNMADARTTVDKLRLSFLYRDKITGQTDRRLLEQERIHNNERQALYTTCKKFLLSSLDWFESENIENKEYIRIQIDSKFDSVLYDILNSIQFESYSWVEEDRNEDLIALGASVPHIINFSVRYMKE